MLLEIKIKYLGAQIRLTKSLNILLGLLVVQMNSITSLMDQNISIFLTHKPYKIIILIDKSDKDEYLILKLKV